MRPTPAQVTELSRRIADDGKLVAAGWLGYQMMVIPDGASETQVNETRQSFFAGAQHLFTSIMTILDSGAEPTASDLRKMDLIHRELDEFGKQFALRFAKPEGSA